jgi:hypothetical protein
MPHSKAESGSTLAPTWPNVRRFMERGTIRSANQPFGTPLCLGRALAASFITMMTDCITPTTHNNELSPRRNPCASLNVSPTRLERNLVPSDLLRERALSPIISPNAAWLTPQ